MGKEKSNRLRTLIRHIIFNEAISSDKFGLSVSAGSSRVSTSGQTTSPTTTTLSTTSSSPDEVETSPGQPPLSQSDADISKQISDAYPLMKSYADDIVRVSREIGIEPKWLANVINFESKGGMPTAVMVKTNATGLIQFMPKTAAKLGTSTSALLGMTGKEQMVYVKKYFEPFKGRLRSQEDVYMAVFYPEAIGKPDFEFSAAIQSVNKGIKSPKDYAKMANDRAKLV